MKEIKELDLTNLETVAGGSSDGKSIHFIVNLYKGSNYIDCFSCISFENVSARATRMCHAHRECVDVEKVHVYLLDDSELNYDTSLAANGIGDGSILKVVIDA